MDSLRQRKKVIIFPHPRRSLAPSPLIPDTEKKERGRDVKRLREMSQVMRESPRNLEQRREEEAQGQENESQIADRGEAAE